MMSGYLVPTPYGFPMDRGRVLLALVLLAPTVTADEKPSPESTDFFEKKVRPVLVKHCYSCHSADAKQLKGELHLDTRDGVRRGGASGLVVVPGEPARSLLIKAVNRVG